MQALTAAERRELRTRAQGLDPVVSVGRQGLTPSVLHELDVNLLAHELVKVRVFNADREEREGLLARICAELEAAPVQHIGKLLVVWRPTVPAPEDDVAAGKAAKGRQRGHPSSPRGGRALSSAKSTPRARRPREPAARPPARPPATHNRRTPALPSPPGGRRRRGPQGP